MQILATRDFLDLAIYKNSDKRRPHIYEIQAVEAMRDNENIRRKCGTVGVRAADRNDQGAGKSANRRVKKRTGKTAEREIVGNKLGRTGKNLPKIAPELRAAHTCNSLSYRRSNKERKI